MLSPAAAAAVLAKAERLYTQQEVEHALDRVAHQISAKLSTQDPILLCVLNGGLITMGYLMTRLPFPLRQDYVHASRYRGETSGAELQWIRQPQVSLQGETVLLVDDILDEGVTLAEIVKHCRQAGASSVYSAVLVEKKHRRGIGFSADFVALQVPDKYVFGYGMDYRGYLRNTPGIYSVDE
jgi:hypoxanthine phosphoribosyltransferase